MIIRFFMKPGHWSRTAEHMALFRGLESVRSPKRRLFFDPLASRFLNPRLRLMITLAHFSPFRSLLSRYIDWRCPGARTSGTARTRLIDDILTAALEDGISQVVTLGAGFDARPYRIPCPEVVSFYEVDHPDTLNYKRSRLQTVAGPLRRNIRYVEIDFNTQSLSSALTQAGFDAAQRAFFIWEGVTNYLSADAVRDTLKFVGSVARHSQVIFTYVHRDFFRSPHRFTGAAQLKRDLERLEEPWTFGLDPAEITRLLGQYGLRLLKDTGSVEYREHYLGNTRGMLSGYEFYRAALAEANPIWNRNSLLTEQKEVSLNA
jgi:methyltransferase (TIGR00027 family)